MEPSEVLSRLGRAAEDLRVVVGRRGVLAVRRDLAQPVLHAGFGPDDTPRLVPLELVGKRSLEGLPAGGEILVVRRFHHGGLARWLTRDRFLSPERPFVELCLQRELESKGFRSPQVVAARAVRAWPFGWRLALATRRVEGALDLAQAMALRQRGELDLTRARALLREAGRFTASLHAAGFLHADLTPRNVLVERPSLFAGQPRLWVIDLDRSRWIEPLPAAARLANLRRLARHVERLGQERGLALGRTDRMRFMAAWCADRTERRRAWRAIAARRRLARPLHALTWLIERRLGRGRSGAEGHLGPQGSKMA